jgi:plastocyanin
MSLLFESTPAISQAPPSGPIPAAANGGTKAPTFKRVIKVELTALDQPIMWNRLGSAMPGGMVFALLRDVVPTPPQTVTINATFDPNLPAPHNLAWDPSTPSLRVGDTVRWRISNDPANPAVHHGVMILDWNKAQAFLDIVPGALPFGPQPGFPAPAQGTPGDGTQGKVLLTAKVKFVPPGGATVPFECTIHKQKMTGQLNLVPPLSPGRVMLRGAKRPRPIVLRANVGDCLEIHFTNLLDPGPIHGSAGTRYAGVHASGLELVDRIDSNGSWIGANPGATGGLVAPGKNKIYKYFAREEGTFLLYSGGDPSENQVTFGLFGAVNVQPVGAEWYRSQVTREDLRLASYAVTNDQVDEPNVQIQRAPSGRVDEVRNLLNEVQEARPGPARAALAENPNAPPRPDYYEMRIANPKLRTTIVTKVVKSPEGRLYNATGHPLVNYDAVYLAGSQEPDGTPIPDGTPVLDMLQARKLGKVVDAPLQKNKSYDSEYRDLEAGIIPPALAELFEAAKVPLSTSASVSGLNGYAWLIVDKGRAYYVEVDIKAAKILVSHAELELVKSDLTAIITGPNADEFPFTHTSPSFRLNLAYPDRRQPYREFTVIYHSPGAGVVQAFPEYNNANLQGAYSAGQDLFAINYGMAGIGSEIIANRVGVGPMGNPDAVDLKYEEFFLSSWACGDPAMVVDVPANAQNQVVDNPDQSLQVIGEPLFEIVSTPAITASLSAGALPQAVLQAFSDNNIALGGTWKVSTPLNNVAWLITDPNNLNKAASPDRKRYALVAATRTDGTAVLRVSRGLPVAGLAATTVPLTPAGFNTPSGKKATKAFFPDDPSNVYHSYMRDHVKFRLLHAGPGPSHVHHLHAHQWLYSPNADNAHYLDSQLIVPGSAYTLEITYGGSGNRNLTPGDSIFHCHFYPHFAQGMWSLWRVHDVFEEGTKLGKDGRPDAGARALPDGEIERGTPIPAIVPMPTLAMAPIPARVELTNLDPLPGGQGRRAKVIPENHEEICKAIAAHKVPPPAVYRDPGYPFFIPGVAGHRAPHPPLDFAWRENEQGQMLNANGMVTSDAREKVYLDGGLPRHLVLGGTVNREFHTRWDFTKDTDTLLAFRLLEEGTRVERAAMAAHSTRSRPTPLPNTGQIGNFLLNGLPPTNGAPYANPSVNDAGSPVGIPRRYKAAVIQSDVVLNKKGWHFPQQRMLTLWGDIKDTIDGTRPPQPFFFRATTGDSIIFWHTNLVPDYYELDDFQVRTPTDIIGQHIHLVKFDVTSSDGAGNGFNYEDGTFSPAEVRNRIKAISSYKSPNNAVNVKPGLFEVNPYTGYIDLDQSKRIPVKVKPYADNYPVAWFGSPPAGQNWDGAQTTIQRWDTDPLLNNQGADRTLRTVFTHDHFSPSTHQQVGLYAGLLVEPSDSKWFLPNGREMNVRSDGGPTSWEGYIVAGNQNDFAKDSFREFAFEFQDSQLAYARDPKTPLQKLPSSDLFDPKNAGASAAFDIAQVFSINVPGLVDALDQTNVGQVVPRALTVVFPTFGVPLSNQATLTSKTAEQWTIQEPATIKPPAQGNAGEIYVLKSSGNSLLVYTPGISPSYASPALAIQPPGAGKNANVVGPPYPQLISSGQNGTYSFNYRNEPVPSRVAPGSGPITPDNQSLAHVFRSIERSDPDLNRQPVGLADGPGTRPYPPTLVPGANPFDPYTPLLRAYERDHVQLRMLPGAFTQAHVFQMQGVRWNFEPDYPNSGFRAAQSMGISEHFEMLFSVPTASAAPGQPFADYFYAPSSDTAGLNNGLWGLFRAYNQQVGTKDPGKDPSADYLKPLPNNPIATPPPHFSYAQGFQLAPKHERRIFNVTAITVAQALSNRSAEEKGRLIYNSRVNTALQPLIFDEQAIIYVRSVDLTVNDKTGTLLPNVVIEPIVLRAAAGDWIKVNLTNAVDPSLPAFTSTVNQGNQGPFNNNPLPPVPYKAPPEVGLHAQLVSYDAGRANGLNAGFNRVQTVKPGETREYYWYAGTIEVGPGGKVDQEPVEFGVINLVPADLQVQHQRGLYGALVIEPKGSSWVPDLVPSSGATNAVTQASATVTPRDSEAFREFVVVVQNDPNFITLPTNVPFECTIHKQKMTGQLNLVSGPQTVTINATFDPTMPAPHNLAWNPTSPTLRVGDTVQWKVDNVPANPAVHHGVMFLGWDTTQAFLEIVPGGLKFGPQPGFPAPAQGTAGDGTQGALLLTAKVKSVPPGGATLPFECTIHQAKMTGQLNLVSGPQTVTINATFDPMLPAPHNLAWNPSSPTLRVGDTVQWKVDNVPANPAVHHGVMFLGWDTASNVLEILPGGLKFGPQPGFPPPAQGTPGDGVQGDLLLTAQFKPRLQSSQLTTTGAVNYRSEPFPAGRNPRSSPTTPVALGPLPAGPPLGFARALAYAQVNGVPCTPIFQARVGTPVRFRVVFPGGICTLGNLGAAFEIEGHVWQDEPFFQNDTVKRPEILGDNPLANRRGMQQILPYEAINILLPSAGGTFKVPGDYLYNTYQRSQVNGSWGIFRVIP